MFIEWPPKTFQFSALLHCKDSSIGALIVPDEIINERLQGLATADEFSFQNNKAPSVDLFRYAKALHTYLR